MSDCHYEQISERTTRITGLRFLPGRARARRLEGAARSASATWACAASATLHHRPCGCRHRLGARAGEARFGTTGHELHYNVYGRDGVMGALEAARPARA